jgi:hypothetical protein
MTVVGGHYSYDPEDVAHQAMATGLMNLIDIGLAAAQPKVPKWRNHLWEKLQLGNARGQTRIWPQREFAQIDSNLPYQDAQENAGRFCATPRWMPPHKPLLEWVMDRWGLSGNEANSAAWAIRRHIAIFGIRPKNYMSTAYDAIEDAIPDIAEETGMEYMARMGV